jgi:hypothetical protein
MILTIPRPSDSEAESPAALPDNIAKYDLSYYLMGAKPLSRLIDAADEPLTRNWIVGLINLVESPAAPIMSSYYLTVNDSEK